MLDRVRSFFKRASPRDETVPGRRVAVLVVLGLGDRPSLATLLPDARAGRLDAGTGHPLRQLVTGRAGGAGEPLLLRALAEQDVPFAAVNLPVTVVADGGVFTGPGLDAPLSEQARALTEAAEGDAWRVLVGAVAASTTNADQAWALLEEALAFVRRAAGPDALVLVLRDSPGEIVAAAPGVAAAPLDHVAWVDVAPTVLRALDLNVPEGLDGLPVEEVLPARAMSAEDERKVQEHLEKLGYL